MGMDVYGKINDDAYFRNSVWNWHPLADYCQRVAPHLVDDNPRWHTNDGHGLDELHSLALADILQAKIDSGECLTYQQEYERHLATIPDEACVHCHGTGTRDDEYVKGKCNACDGKGYHRPFDVMYPFDVENVQEFVEFLRISGGFEIW